MHQFITITSHERDGAWNRRQLGSLFNSLFTLTTKKAWNLRIIGSLWGESVGDRSSHMMSNGNAFIYIDIWHGVFIFSWTGTWKAPSHYQKQRLLLISQILWHSQESNSTASTQVDILNYNFGNYTFKIIVASLCGQWVKPMAHFTNGFNTFLKLNGHTCLLKFKLIRHKNAPTPSPVVTAVLFFVTRKYIASDFRDDMPVKI